jgi:hypothetical protein
MVLSVTVFQLTFDDELSSGRLDATRVDSTARVLVSIFAIDVVDDKNVIVAVFHHVVLGRVHQLPRTLVPIGTIKIPVY